MQEIVTQLCLASLLTLSLVGCQRSKPLEPTKEYSMEGQVMSLDPAAQLATVKHEKIEGWMGAMTMEYPVKDKLEFQKLKVGDHIQAKIDVTGQDYWIATVSPDSAKPDSRK